MTTVTRTCIECGSAYLDYNRRPVCRDCASHDCPGCGRFIRGYDRVCHACMTKERTCATCGASFQGRYLNCRDCRVREQTCTSCARTYRATGIGLCPSCAKVERTCITCGRTFRGAVRECDTCSGRGNARRHARRSREAAARVMGPLPRSAYQRVMASGPCVYCGAAATTADHVRPLSQGGEEATRNLVPACARCNKSKGPKLLIHWDPVRVACGVANSAIVAAELEREKNQVLRPPKAV